MRLATTTGQPPRHGPSLPWTVGGTPWTLCCRSQVKHVKCSRPSSYWAHGQEARMRNRASGLLNARSLTGLTFALMVSCLILSLSGSATILGGGELPSARFDFALIGDMPYDARQEREFANLMK